MRRWIPSLSWLLIALLVLTLCLLSGCRSSRPADAGPAPDPRSAELGEQLLAAFRDRDYDGFAALVPEPCRAETPEPAFRSATENLARQFGSITSWRYLGEAETPGFRQLLWLVRFERSPAAPGKADAIRRELLFRLLTGDTGSEVKIAGFGFL